MVKLIKLKRSPSDIRFTSSSQHLSCVSTAAAHLTFELAASQRMALGNVYEDFDWKDAVPADLCDLVKQKVDAGEVVEMEDSGLKASFCKGVAAPQDQMDILGIGGVCAMHVSAEAINDKLPPGWHVVLGALSYELYHAGILIHGQGVDPKHVLDFAAAYGVPVCHTTRGVGARAKVVKYGRIVLSDGGKLDTLVMAAAIKRFGCAILVIAPDLSFASGRVYLERSCNHLPSTHAVLGYGYNYGHGREFMLDLKEKDLFLLFQNNWRDEKGNYHGVTNAHQVASVRMCYYVSAVTIIF